MRSPRAWSARPGIVLALLVTTACPPPLPLTPCAAHGDCPRSFRCDPTWQVCVHGFMVEVDAGFADVTRDRRLDVELSDIVRDRPGDDVPTRDLLRGDRPATDLPSSDMQTRDRNVDGALADVARDRGAADGSPDGRDGGLELPAIDGGDGGEVAGDAGAGDGAVADAALLPGVLVARAVSLGARHSCVEITGLGVKCWGDNDHGQLGIGSTLPRGDNPGEMGAALPEVSLDREAGLVQVAAGEEHSCALLASGRIHCWGANGDGQLGLDNEQTLLSPGSAVALGEDFWAITLAVGSRHSCAASLSGAVICWGLNGGAQLGFSPVGANTAFGDAPGEMAMLPELFVEDPLNNGRPTMLALGSKHSCALFHSGALHCWGADDRGQCGAGLSETVAVEESVVAVGATVAAVAAGDLHTCAALTNGELVCFGDNNEGQLGLGTLDNYGNDGEGFDAGLTVDLGPSVWVTDVAAGTAHTCALLSDQQVKCWGDNSHGQLGVGDDFSRGREPGEMGEYLPPIQGLPPILAVAAAGNHTCALLASGRVACWGENTNGQLGLGDTTDRGDGGSAETFLATVDLATCTDVGFAIARCLAGNPSFHEQVCLDGFCRAPGTCVDGSCNLPGPLWPLPDTGQTLCYGEGGAAISCGDGVDCESSGVCGQDALVGWDAIAPAERRPQERFYLADATAEVTTDLITGLMWQRCPLGGCESSTGSSWNEAMQRCHESKVGDHADWRLPDLHALQSLLTDRSGEWLLPEELRTSGAFFWSSTRLGSTPLGVRSGNGRVEAAVSEANQAYCVRDHGFFAQGGPRMSSYSTPDVWIARDNWTDLSWDRCLYLEGFPQPTSCPSTSWSAAFEHCTSLAEAQGLPWRLPSARELMSIVDLRRPGAPYNSSVLGDASGGTYWSSTTDPRDGLAAMVVDLGADGTPFLMAAGKGEELLVRCVFDPL